MRPREIQRISPAQRRRRDPRPNTVHDGPWNEGRDRRKEQGALPGECGQPRRERRGGRRANQCAYEPPLRPPLPRTPARHFCHPKARAKRRHRAPESTGRQAGEGSQREPRGQPSTSRAPSVGARGAERRRFDASTKLSPPKQRERPGRAKSRGRVGASQRQSGRAQAIPAERGRAGARRGRPEGKKDSSGGK